MKKKKIKGHYAEKGKTKQADIFDWLDTEKETKTKSDKDEREIPRTQDSQQ